MPRLMPQFLLSASRLAPLQAGAWVWRLPLIAVILLIAAAWIGLNLALPALGWLPLDPAPFFWLQGAVAFTALMMTVLILTTQRREDQLIELREQLILQLAIIADQKAAKTIELLESLRRDLPSVRNRRDSTAEVLSAPADPGMVAEALKETQLDHPPKRSRTRS